MINIIHYDSTNTTIKCFSFDMESVDVNERRLRAVMMRLSTNVVYFTGAVWLGYWVAQRLGFWTVQRYGGWAAQRFSGWAARRIGCWVVQMCRSSCWLSQDAGQPLHYFY
jgi:hypothetical protein